MTLTVIVEVAIHQDTWLLFDSTEVQDRNSDKIKDLYKDTDIWDAIWLPFGVLLTGIKVASPAMLPASITSISLTSVWMLASLLP